jgi:hypothetical protein
MTEIVTTLSISSAGKYTYSPNSVTVTKPNTLVTYTLDPKTAVDWEIVGQTNTDSEQQISGESKAPSGNSITLTDVNSRAESFDVTILTQHRTQRDRIVRIDPGIENVPE